MTQTHKFTLYRYKKNLFKKDHSDISNFEWKCQPEKKTPDLSIITIQEWRHIPWLGEDFPPEITVPELSEIDIIYPIYFETIFSKIINFKNVWLNLTVYM